MSEPHGFEPFQSNHKDYNEPLQTGSQAHRDAPPFARQENFESHKTTPLREREEFWEEESMPNPNPAPHRPYPWRKRLAIGVSIIGVLTVALMVLPIPFGRLEVAGSQKLTVQDIITSADISEPVNILQIRSGKVEDRLRHDLRIESAKVSYVFPLTMRISVVERIPLAVAANRFGYIMLDKSGQAIQLGSSITNTTIPIISGIKLGNVLLGDNVAHDGVSKALQYLNALTPEGLHNISEINVGNPDEIIAYTVKDLPIHLGNGDNLPEKAKLTEEMLKDIKNRNVQAQYIDVNIKSPFIKTR